MILARAPYRISLGGGGTDLPSYYSKYGGFILSAAINKYVNVYVNRPAADSFIRLKYSRSEQVEHPDQIQHDLVRIALQELELGASLEIASMADVPSGTGLGSSGTYLVALLAALHELKRARLPDQALAEHAYHIEMNLAGHPGGKHDHYLATFGGITCLDIDRDGEVRVTPLNLSATTVEDLRSTMLLFFTGVTRSSDEILSQQANDTERGDSDVIESLHLTKEIGYRIKEALESGDVERFGLLLNEHWQIKKRRSTRISNSAVDSWYALAKQHGALGGKLVGAGGGGFLVFSCPPSAKAGLRDVLLRAGLREMTYDFDFEGVKILVNF